MAASHAEKVADSPGSQSSFCVTALLYSGGGFVISLGVLTIAAMILKPKLPSAWHTKRKREVK